MSARTCQLCGKPLSRIWVGAGGDFCSREHRNQYRLRLGMDRLQEANKVATLMRRRENLKPIPCSQVESAPSLMRRGFHDNEMWPHEHLPVHVPRGIEPHSETQLCRSACSFLPPQPHAANAAAGARHTSYVDAAPPAPHGPVLPEARGHRMAAALPAAGVVTRRQLPAPPARRLRDFGIYRRSSSGVQLGRARGRAVEGGNVYAKCSMPARELAMLARKGQPLRVSSSQGFRLGQVVKGSLPAAKWPEAAMVWPSARALKMAMQAGTYCTPTHKEVAQPRPGMRLPPGRTAARAHAMGRRNPRTIRGTPQDFRGEPRHTGIVWPHFEEKYDALCPNVAIPPQLDYCAWKGSAARRVHIKAVEGAPAPQLSSVPFEPQEPPFGYSALEIQTPGMPSMSMSESATASIMPGETPHPHVPTAEEWRIEEHFDAGWKDWIGGTADWKVDAAGVRTGSLALFAPSLDLTDYEFEFLTRIDHHSVTWVFRATDETEYHVASIANVAGGRSLTRSTVIEGNPGLSVTKSLKSPANPKAAVTVQTHVRGNEFAVLVDGEIVDRWTDNRLPIGGVGFAGTPDDPARLYWIRVSSAAEIGKEKDRS